MLCNAVRHILGLCLVVSLAGGCDQVIPLPPLSPPPPASDVTLSSSIVEDEPFLAPDAIEPDPLLTPAEVALDLEPAVIDACPDDPEKIDPGICGCGVSDADTDDDATPDCLDTCPADPEKIEPGACGCGVADHDTDGDLTPDCLDKCPLDLDRIDDVDTDGDGAIDCVDACPKNPDRTTEGLCGCLPELPDDNLDGVPDGCDLCPDDPNKIAAGVCGCGRPDDADRDGDGAPDCLDECPDNANRILAGVGGRVTFVVTFDDPTSSHVEHYQAIETVVIAAGLEWVRHLATPRDVSIETQIAFDELTSTTERYAVAARGRSLHTVPVSVVGGEDVRESAVASEIRTGVDPNGEVPDALIVLDVSSLNAILWFDPDPSSGTAAVPVDRLDAYSLMLHELGHVLGFAGWRDGTDGTVLPLYGLRFDALTIFDGGDFFFVGERSNALYGGPVPLSFGNIRHVGNPAPLPGSQLLELLMNGAGFRYGQRYAIADLELAMLADVGMPMRESGEDVEQGCGR